MRFEETQIPGAYIIHHVPVEDDRGFFSRTFCQREFLERGLNQSIAQCSISLSRARATLRGMHYQAAPFEESKLVRCTRGKLYDVIVDLRRKSPTYMKWLAVELDASSRRMLYVPEGVAHGFETLDDNTEVFYQISQYYNAESARGVRWNDLAFGIKWPLLPSTMSDKDRTYPDYIE
jgi:dTDP-4-dehydrorhamnose 3,5-epimerase